MNTPCGLTQEKLDAHNLVVNQRCTALFEDRDGNEVVCNKLYSSHPSSAQAQTGGDPVLIQRLAFLEQEVADSHHVLPPRHMESVKHSSVLFMDRNKNPAGVGFFVSNDTVITADHNLKDHGNNVTQVPVKYFGARGRFVSSSLTVKKRYPDHDLAVLSSSTSHISFLSIGSNDSMLAEKRVAVTSFSIAITAELSGIKFDGDGFAVLPAEIIRLSRNHIVYLSNCFSGDSGGAVVFSKTGEVIALHLETVNQANEELEHGNYTLEDVANSVNSVTRGFSQGFLGLRLDSDCVRNMIFNC